jgi:hypothetical protein
MAPQHGLLRKRVHEVHGEPLGRGAPNPLSCGRDWAALRSRRTALLGDGLRHDTPDTRLRVSASSSEADVAWLRQIIARGAKKDEPKLVKFSA